MPRSDRDDATAAVTHLGQEVRNRDPRRRRIEAPEDDVVGLEPVVRAAARETRTQRDDGPHREIAGMRRRIGDRRTDLPEETVRARQRRTEVEVAAQLADDALTASTHQGVDQRAGYLVEGLVPADALEASRATLADPLQRVGLPRRADQQIAAARALLTATRIPIGNRLVGSRVGSRLLLAPHDPVADVEVPGARRDAVRTRVGAAHHPIPGPAIAIDVAPVAVGLQSQRSGLIAGRYGPREPVQTQGQRASRGQLQKAPS